MFSKHLFKTLLGFCGMILFGLASLVIIDNYQKKAPVKQVPVAYSGTEDLSDGSANNTSNNEVASAEVRLLPYHEALGIYTGRRIEVSNTCQMMPNNMTFKNDTKVMIDNRSPSIKTIRIGKTTTTIKENGFKILNLTVSKPPARLGVDCDGLKNIASITLEK